MLGVLNLSLDYPELAQMLALYGYDVDYYSDDNYLVYRSNKEVQVGLCIEGSSKFHADFSDEYLFKDLGEVKASAYKEFLKLLDKKLNSLKYYDLDRY